MTQKDLKQIEELLDKKNFATKDDLKNFATKDDLKNFATKDDLKNFATKDDVGRIVRAELEAYPTKNYLDKRLTELKDDLETTIGIHGAAILEAVSLSVPTKDEVLGIRKKLLKLKSGLKVS